MRIETTHRVDHPHRDVVDWHERPGALIRLTPPGLATPDDPAEGGTRAGRIVGVRLGPPLLPDVLRPRWVVRHTDSDGQGRFTDRQAHGPWRTWQHEHEIRPEVAEDPSRTGLHEVIDVELPRRLSRLEPLAERQIRSVLSFRASQLREDLDFHARFAGTPRRTIAITGSSGLIGTQLAALLESGGHTVRRMIREDAVGPGEIAWDPRAGVLDPGDLEGVDVVINLAGRSIATRWTKAARRQIYESRIHGTALLARTPARMANGPRALAQPGAAGYYAGPRPARWAQAARRQIHEARIHGTALLARTLARMDNGPRALVQASAVGYYGGQRPGELLTESDPGGEGFLAEVVRDWEAAARPAAEAGVRVAAVRTGVVLSDAGGALLPQLPLFLAGVGGRLNHPEAVTSWITLDDIARVFAHAALSVDVEGPLNGVAPQPATAHELARTLGKVLRRPALVPVPGFGPRLVLGAEGARELVQADQNVSDARLQASGFHAAHGELEQALRHVLRR